MACIVLFCVLSTSIPVTYAIEDPTKHPNNKMGIHILFPPEIEEAAQLVNANNAEWGYVIIPIQAGDKNLEKWQKFMNDAHRLKITPIIRLATEGDYFNTKVWRKPNDADIADFANFLNSLEWPTKNRYIVVFNETNRGDEWGGEPDASEYAKLLSFAVTVFKSKHQDFFIISGGLDNASANVSGMSVNPYDYLRQMNNAVPGIFNQIDGLGSHSYPNPAFAQPPTKTDHMSIASFKHEQEYIKSMGGKDLPAFITETGWSKEEIDEETIAKYYKTAFETAWNDPNLVTVIPFLLRAGAGPFEKFSFIKQDNSFYPEYNSFKELAKVKGKPTVNKMTNLEKIDESVLGTQTLARANVKSFKSSEFDVAEMSPVSLHLFLTWLLKI